MRNITHRGFCAVILVTGLTIGAIAQTTPPGQQQAPSFEVATIKPANTNEATGIRVGPNRFSTINATVIDLMKYAYGVHEAQIIGVPEPILQAHFDIDAATGSSKMLPSDVTKQMVRNLLADRFHLTFHASTKELSVYLLTAENSTHLTPTAHPDFPIPAVGHGPGGLSAQNATIHDITTFLQRYVTNRPVVDQTGIQGRFDIELHYTPDDAPPPAADDKATQEYPNLFTAIREQLGLKLQAARAPDDVMIIDTITQPTAD